MVNRLDPDLDPRRAPTAASSRRSGRREEDVDPSASGDLTDDFSWCVGGDALEAAPSQAPPPRLGSYRVGRLLGRGGGGSVFVARCTSLDRDVALKVLHADEPGEVARFLGEARAVARLRHPNIVAVHEVGCDQGRWFIAFDLVRGESLARRIERAGRLEPREAARVALRLARALDYAHGRGLLHRDVKPANVVMAPGGEPLLTDFGLAKDLRSASGLTARGDVLGTPAYMSPEQARGQALDARCDVYSLGATLHEMLAGEPPFTGGPVQVLAAVLGEEAPPLPGLAPADAPLGEIVARCLQKDPAARHASAGDLARDLERYLAGEVVAARPSSSALAALAAARRVRRAVAASACAVALAAAAALLVMSSHDDPVVAGASASAIAPDEAGGPGVALEVRSRDRATDGAGDGRRTQGRGAGEAAGATEGPGDVRAPRVALAPPGSDDGPGGGGRSGRAGARAGGGGVGGFTTLPDAPPVDVDDPSSGFAGGDAGARAGEGAAARRARLAGRFDGAEGAGEVAAVDSMDPVAGDGGDAAVEPSAPTPPAAVEETPPSVGDDEHEDDHHDDGGEDDHRDDEHEDDHHDDGEKDDDEREDGDYRAVLQPSLDPQGYDWDSYYQPNTAAQGYVSALQPLGGGDLLIAAAPPRIDGVVAAQARVEAQPPAPVSNMAGAAGLVFAATSDPAVPGAGDVHVRDGAMWSLAFDGAGREARVAALGPTVYVVSGDADAGTRVHARDAIDGTWREVADLGRAVPGAAAAFDDQVWIGARAQGAGARARVFRGAGGAWSELAEPFDGDEPEGAERQEVTALLAVGEHLFAALAIFDPTGAPVSGQLMALGQERFKRVADLSLDAPTALAYHDGTVYVGTRRGRLLRVERDGAGLTPVSDAPTSAGVTALLTLDARTLLVGVQGPYGAEVLRRTARSR